MEIVVLLAILSSHHVSIQNCCTGNLEASSAHFNCMISHEGYALIQLEQMTTQTVLPAKSVTSVSHLAFGTCYTH